MSCSTSSAISVKLASSSESFCSPNNGSFEKLIFIFFFDCLTGFADTTDGSDGGSTSNDVFIVGFFPFRLGGRFAFAFSFYFSFIDSLGAIPSTWDAAATASPESPKDLNREDDTLIFCSGFLCLLCCLKRNSPKS